MYDLDHMLNGSGSRQHHQDIIRQAQQAKFARKVKPSAASNKAISPLRAILVAIINLVIKTF
jgi:hypothetical protein